MSGIPHFVFLDAAGRPQAAAVGKLPPEVLQGDLQVGPPAVSGAWRAGAGAGQGRDVSRWRQRMQGRGYSPGEALPGLLLVKAASGAAGPAGRWLMRMLFPGNVQALAEGGPLPYARVRGAASPLQPPSGVMLGPSNQAGPLDHY